MEFKDKLAEYMRRLNCTAKDLSRSSGLSETTISHYRCGKRVPRTSTGHLASLVKGIAHIAEEKNIADITMQSALEDFSPLASGNAVGYENLPANLGSLLTSLSVNISELSRCLNYDPSFISRIKNGQRKPADLQKFVWDIAGFISRRYQGKPEKAILVGLIDCRPDELGSPDNCRTLLAGWLADGSVAPANHPNDFLEKIDSFNLNDYMRTVRFDECEADVCPPIPDAVSKSYIDLKEIKDGMLDFLKGTALSEPRDPVIMYADIPLKELAEDSEFFLNACPAWP